jgi:hypothetical protein
VKKSLNICFILVKLNKNLGEYMKLKTIKKNILNENNGVYIEDIEKELEKAFELLNGRVLGFINTAFTLYEKEKNSILNPIQKQVLVSDSTEIKGNNLFEGKRDSIRLSILSKAWNKKIKIKKPKLIKVPKGEKNNIIKYLIRNKERIKFSSVENNKSKTKIYDNINSAIDIVFTKEVLNRLFDTSNKNLYKAIMGELKEHIEEKFINSKEFLVNTDKRLSELDITFLDKLKDGNLSKLEPNGPNTFPDYIYTFSSEPEKYEGEQQLLNFLKNAGISKTSKIYIEMKGNKTSRIVSSQTTSGRFFEELGENLKDKLSSLLIDDKPTDLNQGEFEKIISAANLSSAFRFPTLYVKPAREEIAIFYLGNKDFKNFKIKRQKKSISIFTESKNKNGKIIINKMFSIELTGTANEKIFGNGNS